MRILLLLSALLTAFAGAGAPARAAGVSAAQVSALVEQRSAQAAVVASGKRPGFAMPSVLDVAAAPVGAGATVIVAVPLYFGRLRV